MPPKRSTNNKKRKAASDALRVELTACGDRDPTQAGGDAARLRPSALLPYLPDELVALAMSFVLTRARQWRDLSLVCRQFQRCGLLPEAHQHMSLVVCAGSVGRAAEMARSLSGLRVIDARFVMTDEGLLSVAQLTSLQTMHF